MRHMLDVRFRFSLGYRKTPGCWVWVGCLRPELKALASQFGVCAATIHNIYLRKTWDWLEG